MNIAIFLLMAATQGTPGDSLTLSVEEAVAMALESNPTLQAYEAKAEAKAQLPLQASPAFLPTLSIDMQSMKTTDPVAVFGLKLRQENFAMEDLALDALNRPDSYTGYNTTATIQMPILAPEGLFGFRAAQKAAEAEKAGARRAAGATRFFTIQAYTGALLASRQVEALDAALEAVRGHVTQAEAMHEQGLVTGLDARMARLKEAEIEVHRLAADAQAKNALSSLKALLDLDDDAEVSLSDGLATIESMSACASAEGFTSEVGGACSWEDRGDLQAYTAGMQAASHGVKKAWAAQLPSIAAFGALGHYSQDGPFRNGSGDWTIGIGLRWTPFSGLSGVGSVRAAKAEEAAVKAERNAAYRQAEVEVLQAQRMLEAARDGADVASRAAEEARVALEQAQARYRSGTAPITELLDVQAASTNATLSELSARRDLVLAHAALDLAYGVFDR